MIGSVLLSRQAVARAAEALAAMKGEKALTELAKLFGVLPVAQRRQ